jgi:hypothetical protein
MTIYHVVPVVTAVTAFPYANRELAVAAIEELIQDLASEWQRSLQWNGNAH